MNIYLLVQFDNTGANTYDSCVVVADSEESARETHPSGLHMWWGGAWHLTDLFGATKESDGGWSRDIADICVTYIGAAAPTCKPGVVCTSFNAV